MKELMPCVKEEYITKRKSEIKNDVLIKYKKLDDWIKLEFLFKEAWHASKGCMNDTFNFDCSINMFLYEGNFYIIPYNPVRNFKAPKIDGVKDYSYWNNTDEPENMDGKEWKNRGITWDRITEDWNRYRFSHEIFDGKDVHCRGQYIVEKKILGEGIKNAFLHASYSGAIKADIEHREKRKSRELT
jgi:hypothetical protein